VKSLLFLAFKRAMREKNSPSAFNARNRRLFTYMWNCSSDSQFSGGFTIA